MTRRILFRVEGNELVGHGHFMRCLSIADYLMSSHKCVFAISNPSELVMYELQIRALKLYRTPSAGQFHPDDNSSSENWAYDLAEFAQEGDLLFLDGYRFDNSFIKRITEKGGKVIRIQDEFNSKVECHGIVTPLPISASEIEPLIGQSKLWSGLDGFLIRRAFFVPAQSKSPILFDWFIYVSSPKSLKFYIESAVLEGQRVMALTLPSFESACKDQLWNTMVAPDVSVLVDNMRSAANALIPASTVAIEYLVATSRTPFVQSFAKNQNSAIKHFKRLGWWKLYSPETIENQDNIKFNLIAESPEVKFKHWINERF
ncbi:hypothetical protein N9L13_01275 [Flavobacteriales bacterium]|nr:hypothetical protein [Flavobacteriales bacterium]